MFLQICIVTAGLHLGRSLYKSWKDAKAAPGDSEPPGDSGAAGEAGSQEPLAAQSSSEPPSAAVVAAPHPEEAAVQEQFEIAIVAAGLTTVAHTVLPQLRLLGAVSVMYGSIPIFQKAKQRLVGEGRVGIEVLDSVGILASMVARQYGISAAMFFLYAGAQKLRLATEKAARESLTDVFGQTPAHAWLLKDGVEVSVPLQSLAAGDIVVVGAGGTIPADGIVTQGLAYVDQQALTGESQPAERAVGDRVFAMTIVIAGNLHIRVETAGKETAAAEITEILAHTADFSSSVELESRRLADASAVPILALGALAFPIVGPRGAVAVLNVGIADNMRVAAPIAMLNSLRRAYESGILLKDGRSLQLVPKVDTVVFDKTGTLTLGQLDVRQVHTARGAGEEDVIVCAAAAEHRQTHPIALAILKEAARREHTVSPIEELHYEVGYGLTARNCSRTIRVGSKRFMSAYALEVPEELSEREQSIYEQGRSLVYVARNDDVIGMIELEPLLRPEVEEVVRALRAKNLSLYLLSGDHEEPTRAMAQKLGFDRHYAGVLPQDKARLIEELQAQGKTVCFVGDGINDAIALKRATVSVSMSGGSAVAANSAQVMLLEQGLGKLPELFVIAGDFQRASRNILLSALIPTAVAVGGVFFAGFSTNAVAALYAGSLASGLLLAMAPGRQKKELAPRAAE